MRTGAPCSSTRADGRSERRRAPLAGDGAGGGAGRRAWILRCGGRAARAAKLWRAGQRQRHTSGEAEADRDRGRRRCSAATDGCCLAQLSLIHSILRDPAVQQSAAQRTPTARASRTARLRKRSQCGECFCGRPDGPRLLDDAIHMERRCVARRFAARPHLARGGCPPRSSR